MQIARHSEICKQSTLRRPKVTQSVHKTSERNNSRKELPKAVNRSESGRKRADASYGRKRGFFAFPGLLSVSSSASASSSPARTWRVRRPVQVLRPSRCKLDEKKSGAPHPPDRPLLPSAGASDWQVHSYGRANRSCRKRKSSSSVDGRALLLFEGSGRGVGEFAHGSDSSLVGANGRPHQLLVLPMTKLPHERRARMPQDRRKPRGGSLGQSSPQCASHEASQQASERATTWMGA